MTAEELIAKAAACKKCGREHEYRRISGNQASWASPEDGHYYDPVLDSNVVARLRFLVTGRYENPWTPKDPRQGQQRKAIASSQ